jgi:hypothetical protein
MVLDRSVLGEELLVIFKFSIAPSTFKSFNGSVVLQRKGMEIAMFFANSQWKMLLTATGQMLGTTKRI